MRDFNTGEGPGFVLVAFRIGKWVTTPGTNNRMTKIARRDRNIIQEAWLLTSGSIPPGLYLVLTEVVPFSETVNVRPSPSRKVDGEV